MTAPGSRIGAILGSNPETKTVQFLGYGVYGGDAAPHEAVGFLAEAIRSTGNTNPRLDLDSGDVVYGCECWWGSEAAVLKRLRLLEEAGYRIETVQIGKVREEYRLQEQVNGPKN